MDRNDRILISGLGTSFEALAVLALVVNYGGGSATAAWVQAIGTILAIVAAIWIAGGQSREAAALAREQARVARATDAKRAYLLTLRLASILMDIEIRLN